MAIPENPITRKEHFLAKAAGESVNTPDPITREEMYLNAIASASGGGGGSADNRFEVTLKPNAADYSGTMDKTSGELYDAYFGGKEIWFTVGPMSAPCTFFQYDDVDNYITMAAYIILDANNLMIVAKTDAREGDIGRNYDTKIYQLTPMGG